MSRPQTYEQRILGEADSFLSEIAHTYDERIQILEAVSAYHSHCDIEKYWELFACTHLDVPKVSVDRLTALITQTGIPFSMAISSLIREPLSIEEQKKNGVFYTDFRLSKFIALDCEKVIQRTSSVADFAAGTGILIAGVAEIYKQKYPETFNEWITSSLFAFDLSAIALRGARAALLSMTNNLEALGKMYENWRITDSLLDSDLQKYKFDIIVGNPPWGKIKLSRHSFLMQNGMQRVYGSQYEEFDIDDYENQKETLAQYSKTIKERYSLMGNAEPDMYMAFLQRITENLASNGHVSFLVPAGLIRSQGTEPLRRYLLTKARYLEYMLLDNKSNFFSIDTRFKFVMLSFDKNKEPDSALEKFNFSVPSITNKGIVRGESIDFDVALLSTYRPDLTIPEVGSEREKTLFFKICKNGRPWGLTDDFWKADISREIDMTNNRRDFCDAASRNSVPVIEGRMVQQHRFGTKSYVSGSGRSAKWEPCSSGGKSQFYFPKDKLSTHLQSRILSKRAGYCDIAGQTNERAMMSAVIPENVVCGNKVPTILFPNDQSGNLIYLWIGITNSFVFDWMIRRVISTTINYFLLFSIPMPAIKPDSIEALKIISKTKQLSSMNGDYYKGSQMAQLRSEIDILVAEAYGLDAEDLELILQDFPLLDRKQPCIGKERKSTVTRDMLLSKYEQHLGSIKRFYSSRYKVALAKNAKAYIPTEMTEMTI